MTHYTTMAAVTGDILMSMIGGTLNLWIGITFFTLMEVLDFCIKYTRKNVLGNRMGETSESRVFPANTSMKRKSDKIKNNWESYTFGTPNKKDMTVVNIEH